MLHHVVLYGRRGCHLCEIAEQMLQGMRRDFDITLQKIDITADPRLVGQYGDKIPVLVIDGSRTLTAPIRSSELRLALLGGK